MTLAAPTAMRIPAPMLPISPTLKTTTGGGGGGTGSISLRGQDDPPEAGDVQAAPTFQFGSVEWPYLVGAYTGSWVAGSLIGYVAQGGVTGAVTGGAAASAVWSLSESYHQFRATQYILGAAFLTAGGASFWWALRRKP